MLKRLIERFKKVFTVKEWQEEAQDAMRKKEFVIEALRELHRVEKLEASSAPERTMTMGQQQMAMGNYGYSVASNSGGNGNREKSNLSLADLMNSIKQRQVK